MSDGVRGLILVIDDDDDIRTAVRDVLQEDGWRVETAANGADALRWLAGTSELPRVVLLDMMMPEMDGWAFMAELERAPRLADLRIIVFSAYGDASRVESIPRATSLLRKPLRAHVLLEALARC